MEKVNNAKKNKKSDLIKLIAVVLIIGLGFFIAWRTGLVEKIKDVEAMQEFFKSYGFLGYLIFILVFIGSCVFMLPGSMLTIIAGIAFGPLFGGVVSLIGATLGATAAFLVSKYVARGMIEDKIGKNEMFKKIDDGVEKNGTSFLILTRLVPVFPFSFQNYAYGLTKINLGTYFIVSFICMAPGAFIYAYMAGEIVTNGFSVSLLVKFAVAGILLFLVSLVPKYIAKKKGINMDELK